MNAMAFARFDDVKPGRSRSLALVSPVNTLQAFSAEEVVGVLAELEEEVERGRWVGGWVSYEAAPGINPALAVRGGSEATFGPLPLACFGVFESCRPASELPAAGYTLGEWAPAVDATHHARDVQLIREQIRQGNVYQVNHTFRLTAPFAGDPLSFYRDLVRSQNGGYCAFLDFSRWRVLSASPELFFEWRDGLLVSRPMKGTIQRGRGGAEDVEMQAALRSSAKDRAENVMIVDMVRNDLGRVAKAGTVEVPTLFATEKYDTVWQLTSTVTAEPRPGTTLAEVFAALFPAASITGAPKVAAMELISRLEANPRGVYCGAIGYGGPRRDGTPLWRFNVGIRTVLIDQATGRGWYGTGGGITYDSTPSGEYAEALLKTRVLARRSSDFDLLETIRWTPDAGFRHLDRHVRRLMASADYFDVPVSDAHVREALEEAVRGVDLPQRVRLRVSRQGGITVGTGRIPVVSGPVRLAVDEVPVDSSDPFLRHKTSRREVFEKAAARHPYADDVILVNERGELTETTIASLVAEVDGRWVTPPLDSGCLPGVERAHLLSAGKVHESVLFPADVGRATGLARVNSLRGWESATLAVSEPRSSLTGT
jgi:para-aminobenzoate synthetase / 4-amino-4-deoxychorismate lyase